MNLIQSLQALSLRKKLIASLLVACLLPLVTVSLISTMTARSAIEAQAFSQLESLREVKKNQIEDYFGQIRNQVITFSEDKMIVEAMGRFAADFSGLMGESFVSPSVMAQYRADVANYYQSEFGREFVERTGGATNVDALIPRSSAAILSQYRYIAANPNPLGSKETMDSAPSGTSYDRTHAVFHPLVRNYLQKFDYYDIFLIDTEGNIVYSVFKELDYATNLKTGPYSNTNFASVFERALELESGDTVALADFDLYLPSYNAAASFIASPIYDGSTLSGVLVFQMPVGKINAIMQERSGLGESGETYLVGTDKLMRSQSRFTEDNTLLTLEVDTDATRGIAEGQTGSDIILDYRAIPVLSSFAPLEIDGLDWGIVAEIDEAEAFAAVDKQIITTIACIVAGVLLAVLLAWFITRSVMRQLGADPVRLEEVVQAIANDDLTMDLTTEGQATGVFEGMQVMQTNLLDRVTADREALEENGRIRQALRNVDGNVLVADAQGKVIFANKAAMALAQRAEADLGQVIPNFTANSLVGCDIEQLHRDETKPPGWLSALTQTDAIETAIGGLTLKTVANPVFDDAGQRIGTALELTDRTQVVSIEREVDHVVQSALRGDLGQRISMDGKSGFFETLSDGVNKLVGVSEKVIDDTVRTLSAMAKGDLRQTIDGEYEGSFNQLKLDANNTADKLKEVVAGIKTATSSVKVAGEEIAQGNLNLSQRTEQQATSLEETSSSMEEMTSTVRQNAGNAAEASKLAAAARDEAETGGAVVNKAVAAMQEINASSKQISDIIGVIDEIAFQTNLLALNASVEAARAGEQGRGFAVVASEVRNLAGRSATAAKEIKELIEDSGRKVDEGSRLVDESGKTLAEIVAGVKKVSDIVSEIAVASEEQSVGIEEVNRAIVQMDELTQQNAALVEEAAAASKSLGDQANELYSLVDFFEVGTEVQAPPQTSLNHEPVERRGADRPWSNPEPQAAAPMQRAANGGDTEWEEF